MPYQIALTILAPVRPGKLESLVSLLEHMGQDPAGNRVIPFERFGQVHFARLVILDESTGLDGHHIPPYLMFLSDIDDPPDGYLRALLDVAEAGVDQVWGHCTGYPEPAARTHAGRIAYLRARMIPSDAVYINTIGRSVKQVLQEAMLREALEDFLDRSWPQLSSQPAGQIRLAIQQFVRNEDTLGWALKPAAPPAVSWRAMEMLHMVGVALLLLLLLPCAVFFLPVWLTLLRIHEVADQPSHAQPDPTRLQALASAEDQLVQNQFSAIGYFKPGWFRRVTAILALWLVNNAVRHIFNRGDLTGVKTIHFARWIPLDQRRRLIFASNYDGSLESYMDDFIDKVAWGLNAVFSNGIGYPRTNWLIMDGARDELAFKNYLHLRQIPTQVWYSAYGHLTAINIANNAKLREGLFGDMSAAQAHEWLALL